MVVAVTPLPACSPVPGTLACPTFCSRVSSSALLAAGLARAGGSYAELEEPAGGAGVNMASLHVLHPCGSSLCPITRPRLGLCGDRVCNLRWGHDAADAMECHLHSCCEFGLWATRPGRYPTGPEHELLSQSLHHTTHEHHSKAYPILILSQATGVGSNNQIAPTEIQLVPPSGCTGFSCHVVLRLDAELKRTPLWNVRGKCKGDPEVHVQSV